MSKKANDKYKLPTNRICELKYFCAQYNDYMTQLINLEEASPVEPKNLTWTIGTNVESDHTAKVAIKKHELREKMTMIYECALEADKEIGTYIFTAVTRCLSFERLKAMTGIPCERDMYYDRLRKFYWLLNARRN